MKLIYLIAGTYNSGGMERVLANKANYLVSHGHEVIIVTTDQRGQQPFFPLDKRIACYDLGINYEENNGKSFFNKVIHVSIRPRACFFPLFSFLPLWLHYNLNPLCVQY